MKVRVCLHHELMAILQARGNKWATIRELAEEVESRGRYRKRDGSVVTVFQVHGRTKNYSRLFERDGARVRLRVP
jgi:hypothetical protein